MTRPPAAPTDGLDRSVPADHGTSAGASAASAASRGAGSPPASDLPRLVSRTRVLAPGEVDDLLDVLGHDGFAWIRAGAGFVTSGVAARIAVGTGPARFERAAEVVAGMLGSIAVDGPSPIGDAGPGAGPIAVGALPFDDRTPGSLVVPAVVVLRRSDGSGWVTTTLPDGSTGGPGSVSPPADPGWVPRRNGTPSAPAGSRGTVVTSTNGSPGPCRSRSQYGACSRNWP